MTDLDNPAEKAYTGPMPTDPAQPVLDAIKAQIDDIRSKALGPHLDTPIYDQLAREYDKKYNNTAYFDSALAEKIKRVSRHF